MPRKPHVVVIPIARNLDEENDRDRTTFTTIRESDDPIDMPCEFCPVCGGSSVCVFSHLDPLVNKVVQDLSCRVCEWRTVVYVVGAGRREFPIRQDAKDPSERPFFLRPTKSVKKGG